MDELRPAKAADAMIAPLLNDSEVRYRRLFESAHDGILIIDPLTRRIIDVNPFLLELLGYSREETVGRELYEIGLLKDESASQAAFRELQEAGQIRYENLPLRTKDGRHVEVEFVSNRYEEGDQDVIQCNIRDISERKKSESARRQADLLLSLHAAELEVLVARRTKELRVCHDQLEILIRTISHDLRAPLRSMQGFSQLLVQEATVSLSSKGKEYANYINTAAQMMDRLLADLLTYSQIGVRKLPLEPVALEELLPSVLSACAPEIRKNEVLVESISPWPAVVAHPATLRQVLMHLVGNAVKFVSSRAAEVRLRAEERSGGLVRIWVEDNGIGILPEFRERIFQVFQRLHTTSYVGTGIGLAIVKKGMEYMGGTVGLESVPGEGSRFWIDLPRARIEKSPARAGLLR